MAPAIAFGTGRFDDSREPQAKLDLLKKHKITELDTARIYDNGGSEKQIGRLHAPKDFTITTKATGWYPGAGKKDNLLSHAKEQWENLGVDKVRVYLLHCPDESVDIGETMDAIQELYKEGRFEKFGLSNFNADQVRACHTYAKKNNYVLPTVYQSNYNLVARHNETGLFPVLKSLGFDEIQAYSPIAGGFLCKTPDQIRNPTKGGRWDSSLGGVAAMYQRLYNKPSLMKFLDDYEKLCKEYGETQLGVAYRWVRHHSALGDQDKMIIGATTTKQLEETLVEIEKGPLDENLVKKLNDSWEGIKDEAPVDNADK